MPANIDYNEVMSRLGALNGVKRVHSLHIWSLAMDTYSLTVHVVAGKLM
jgi:Co/Zn/Cd efflux system component